MNKLHKIIGIGSAGQFRIACGRKNIENGTSLNSLVTCKRCLEYAKKTDRHAQQGPKSRNQGVGS